MIKPRSHIMPSTAQRRISNTSEEAPASGTPTPVNSPARDLQLRLAVHFNGQTELLAKADFARSMGSDFVANVLEAGFRQLERAPQTAKLIRNWVGDPAAAALAMRFNAVLHLLARRARLPTLASLYADLQGDFDGVIGETLACEDAFIAKSLLYPTQTNEVARTGAIVAALMTAQVELGAMPFELIELGASCGLNLNLAHYAFDLGGVVVGTPGSAVEIAPRWSGPPPPAMPLEILNAHGVDLHPLDPRDPATIERQLAFIWADQPVRFRRLERALDLARYSAPRVERANAVTWLERQLQKPQQDGVCRAIFHSMVIQYFAPEDRSLVLDTIRRFGDSATPERPLAWISFEWSPKRDKVELHLTCWPVGETRRLAVCDPYGSWIEWADAA